jgi:DNA repair protein RecN (Recombination protein N)
MLSVLRISNFALIDYLELNLSKGFSAITGETGSGKSILLNALHLILGERADFSVIGPENSKCFVEAEFQITEAFTNFFESNDLDFSSQVVVRREINTHGKSRAFINDTPVSLSILKDFSSRLIIIHSQYNTLDLREKEFQLDVLDCLAELESIRKEYQEKFHAWKTHKQELEKLKTEFQNQAKLLDYNQFQLNELVELNLNQVDYTKLEEELNEIENSEELKSTFHAISDCLVSESGVYSRISALKTTLDRVRITSVKLTELKKRVQTLLPEVKDISEEAEQFLEGLSFNPERQLELTNLMDQFNRIITKHQKRTQEELLLFQIDLEKMVNLSGDLEEQIEKLEITVQKAFDDATILAGVLHSKRVSAVNSISMSVQRILEELNLRDTLLLFQLKDSGQLNTFGTTEIDLLFSANKGIAPIAIEKAASGGELSRVMLALQKLISEKRQLPTMIFDEIDTGVSGEVAHKMASLLGSMSNKTQLLAITHLPQVAAKANQQAKVTKIQLGERVISQVKWLNESEKIQEIARLMSGEKITDAAIENAKNLIWN